MKKIKIIKDLSLSNLRKGNNTVIIYDEFNASTINLIQFNDENFEILDNRLVHLDELIKQRYHYLDDNKISKPDKILLSNGFIYLFYQRYYLLKLKLPSIDPGKVNLDIFKISEIRDFSVKRSNSNLRDTKSGIDYIFMDDSNSIIVCNDWKFNKNNKFMIKTVKEDSHIVDSFIDSGFSTTIIKTKSRSNYQKIRHYYFERSSLHPSGYKLSILHQNTESNLKGMIETMRYIYSRYEVGDKHTRIDIYAKGSRVGYSKMKMSIIHEVAGQSLSFYSDNSQNSIVFAKNDTGYNITNISRLFTRLGLSMIYCKQMNFKDKEDVIVKTPPLAFEAIILKEGKENVSIFESICRKYSLYLLIIIILIVLFGGFYYYIAYYNPSNKWEEMKEDEVSEALEFANNN